MDFTAGGLDLARSAWRASYAVTANRLVTTVVQSRLTRTWNVIGPFPQEFDTAFEPETGPELVEGLFVGRGPGQGPLADHQQRPNGYVNLLPRFKPNENVAAYALAYVKSPSRRKAVLMLGSDDSVKAFLNGRVVASDKGPHGGQAGPGPGARRAGRGLERGLAEDHSG